MNLQYVSLVLSLTALAMSITALITALRDKNHEGEHLKTSSTLRQQLQTITLQANEKKILQIPVAQHDSVIRLQGKLELESNLDVDGYIFLAFQLNEDIYEHIVDTHLIREFPDTATFHVSMWKPKITLKPIDIHIVYHSTIPLPQLTITHLSWSNY